MARSTNTLRVPPQDLEAEKAVLGSIMLRPKAMYEILGTIIPESFYSERHKLIFKTMLDLGDKREPIDLLSLSTRLKEKKLLSEAGGRSYLTELVGTVPSSANIKHYAEIVQKKYILRGLIEAANFVSELSFNENDDEIENILDQAEKKIFNVILSPKTQNFINLREALGEAWERLENLHESKGKLRGLATGFQDLDNILSGLQKSDLIILAARPSMGKTTLGLDIARNVAGNGTPVGIFSLEMSSQQLVDRMLAAEAKVNAWNLRTGRLNSDEDFSKIRDALDKLSKSPIYINDQPGNSIAKMRSTARRMKMEHGLGLIVVDYLQLMTTSKNYDSMVNQVTEISRSLKSLARELEIPVLAISQLSRAIESRGGKPRLSDLRDSGSLEQDSDVVMFIHREVKSKNEPEKSNITEILIEKHRNGPVGKIKLYFDLKTVSFLTIDKTQEEDIKLAQYGFEEEI